MQRDDFLLWETTTHDTVDFKRVYVDMAGGDVLAGLLLSQIVFWHLPNRRGKTKMRVRKNDELWVAHSDNDWYDEIRLTEKQARRARLHLVENGLLVAKRFMFNGVLTMHLRIEWSNFFIALKEHGTPDEIDDLQLGEEELPIEEVGSAQEGSSHLPCRAVASALEGSSLTEITTKTTPETTTQTTPHTTFKPPIYMNNPFRPSPKPELVKAKSTFGVEPELVECHMPKLQLTISRIAKQKRLTRDQVKDIHAIQESVIPFKEGEDPTPFYTVEYVERIIGWAEKKQKEKRRNKEFPLSVDAIVNAIINPTNYQKWLDENLVKEGETYDSNEHDESWQF
jgi:hypothetical protein